MQLAIHFINDAILVIRTGPAHVPLLTVGNLRRLSIGNTVRIQIEMTVAIRIEIDQVANPHGITRGAWSIGDGFRLVCFQIEDVKFVGLSAAVAFLGTKVT